MDLCFLIYWLHVINVLMLLLKLEHNILFILVCILTLEVSWILFITEWDYSFSTLFSTLMTSMYISCALYLRIYFCWVLFLQASNLGEVVWYCSTKHSSSPSVTDCFPSSVSLLLFSLTVYLYICLLTMSPDKHLSIEENYFSVFLSLRDFYPWTSELEK